MYIRVRGKHLKRTWKGSKEGFIFFSCNNSGLEQSDILISKVEYLKRTEQKRLNLQVHLQDFYDWSWWFVMKSINTWAVSSSVSSSASSSSRASSIESDIISVCHKETCRFTWRGGLELLETSNINVVIMIFKTHNHLSRKIASWHARWLNR